jgi:hypothetical protein
MAQLTDLETLERLALYQSFTTDNGMGQLFGLTVLRSLLLLDNGMATDLGPAHLAERPSLQSLHLGLDLGCPTAGCRISRLTRCCAGLSVMDTKLPTSSIALLATKSDDKCHFPQL